MTIIDMGVGEPDAAADPAWNPNASSTVKTIYEDGTGIVYAGGMFTTIGGLARNRIYKK